MSQKIFSILILIVFIVATVGAGSLPRSTALAQSNDGSGWSDQGTDLQQWYVDEQIEQAWKPDYLDLATGDPNLLSEHGVYAWPFDLDSIGWSMQSYQNYGGTPYFHHGMDMMKVYGTNVYNRSGGQVINIENYNPGWDLYWEVAILDPDGYIWQYHHIDEPTIPQYIWDKFAEYQLDPVNGGFIDPDTYIGDIIYWPVWSFGKQFNHIHLNILAAGGVYVNGFEFHDPLPDTVGPEIQDIGLLQNGQVYAGDTIEGDYSLYVRTRDLILDDVYYLPPWEITFSVDGGPEHTTWRFDTLPGGADDTAYLDDFYVVPPTCGDYDCRDYYIDLGFIPDSQFAFPITGGEHTVVVTVSDYAGSSASQAYTYTVIGPPPGIPVWQDDFETDLGWIANPDGTDTATSGQWEWGDPEATYWYGPKQLGTTPSGVKDLVTGRLAGSSANSYDIDGGVTSIRSPDVVLPSVDRLTLSFRYYLAHDSNASNADYLRVFVVGSTSTMVFEELGAANDDDGVWDIKNVSLSEFAGETVHLLIAAADEAGESLVEAGIDNVLILDTSSNQAPTANPQSVSTAEDTPLGIELTGSDPEDDPLSFTVVSNPAHGTLSGAAPNLTYTPAADYNGTDSFTFVVDDGLGSSVPAAVDIDVTPVNDAPLANPQSLSTAEDTPLDIVLTGWDAEDDPLTFTVVSTPTHGILGGSVPTLTYTPTADYSGADSFTFIADDGLESSTPAVVNINVTPVNDAPLAEAQSVSTAEDTPLAIVLTGWDAEDDPLTFTVDTGPMHGILSGSAPTLTYTPTADYNGMDSFTFVVSDGLESSAPAAVDIEVTPVNDAPVANPQSVSTTGSTPLDIVLTGSDPEDDPLTFTVVLSPTHGTLSGVGPSLTYTPAPGYVGPDSFSFIVSDGELDSVAAVVSINMTNYMIYVPMVVK